MVLCQVLAFVFELKFGHLQAYPLLVPRLSIARARLPLAHVHEPTSACSCVINACMLNDKTFFRKPIAN